MQWISRVLEMARRVAQRLGPYVLLEILLPGGTLVALMLFLVRQRNLQRGATWCAPAAPGRVLARIAARGSLVLQRCAARTASLLVEASG
jgi:hypothetical protein